MHTFFYLPILHLHFLFKGTPKMQDMKMQDMKMWHKLAEDGKCKNGKRKTRKVWNAVCQITFVGRL